MGSAASVPITSSSPQIEPGKRSLRGGLRRRQSSNSDNPVVNHSRLQLCSYVPRIIATYLSEQNISRSISSNTVIKPTTSDINAAVVLADISGFTKLTSYLSSTFNRNGPERMTKYLNDYFSKMVSIIALFRGDIIKFAGDALLVIWGSNEEPSEPTRITAATLCAAVLVTQLNQYPVADDIMLSLHAVVDCGAAEGLHIGGVGDKWEFLVVGDFFRRLGPLIDSAAAGEVAVSAAAWRTFARQEPELGNLGRELVIEGVGNASERDGLARIINRTLAEHPAARPLWCSLSLTDPSPTPSPRISADAAAAAAVPAGGGGERSDGGGVEEIWSCPANSGAQGKRRRASITNTKLSNDVLEGLRRYVPVPVLRAVDAGSGKFMAENRRVSVVFVNLPPLEIGSLRLAQGLLEAIQRGLEEHLGMLRQFLTDDKGSVAIAVFGLPPHAGRDDALRCVEFAMKLKQELEGDVARGRAGRLEVRGQSSPLGPEETSDRVEDGETATGGDGLDSGGGDGDGGGDGVPRDFQFSIGVTTGDVYSGNVGHPLRCEYCVIGDSVNMSARLMGACMKKGGGILVDEATYLACASGYEFEPLPAIQVKGKEAPMPVYEPLRPRNVLEEDDNRLRHAVAHFVPRPSITTKLWDRVAKFAAACDSRVAGAKGSPEAEVATEEARGGAVGPKVPTLLIGEPGMGKTQLLYWLCARSEVELQLPFLMVSCDERNQNTPMSTIASLVTKLLRGGPKLMMTSPRDRTGFNSNLVASLLPQNKVENAPLLNFILPSEFHVDAPDSSRLRSMTSLSRAREMLEMLYSLLVACLCRYVKVWYGGGGAAQRVQEGIPGTDANAPKVLLVVDGVHCADSSSLAILQRLQREPSLCVMLVGAGLPGADFGEGAGALELEVGPFGEEQTEEMLRSIMDVPEEVGLGKFFEVVRAEGRGNPLVERKFAEYLVASGAALQQCGINGSTTSVDLLIEVEIDKDNQFVWLNDATRAQLASCGEALKIALKVASVLGVVFDSDLLASVHPVPSHVPLLEETLAAAVDSRLLEPMSSSSRSYRFAFDALQSAVYSLMPEEQRKALHLEVASRLQTSGDTADLVQEALHWLKAGERVNAAEAYYEAGLNAAFIGANSEVIELLQPAMDCIKGVRKMCPRHADIKAKVCTALAQAHLTLDMGGASKAEAAFRSAVELKDEVTDRAFIFPAMSGLVVVKLLDEESDEGRENLEKFIAATRDLENKVHFVRASCIKLCNHILKHEFRSALDFFSDTIEPLYDFESMHEEITSVYGSDWGLDAFAKIGLVRVKMGDLHGAEALMETMRRNVQEVTHVRTRMFSFMSRVWAFLLLEDPEKALCEVDLASELLSRSFVTYGNPQVGIVQCVARLLCRRSTVRAATPSSMMEDGKEDMGEGGATTTAGGSGEGVGEQVDEEDKLFECFWGQPWTKRRETMAVWFGPHTGMLVIQHALLVGRPRKALRVARMLLAIPGMNSPEQFRWQAEAMLGLARTVCDDAEAEKENEVAVPDAADQPDADPDVEWKDEQGDEPEVRSRAELLSDAVAAARRARKMAQQKGARLLELKAALTLAAVAQECWRYDERRGNKKAEVESTSGDAPSKDGVVKAIQVALDAIKGGEEAPVVVRARALIRHLVVGSDDQGRQLVLES